MCAGARCTGRVRSHRAADAGKGRESAATAVERSLHSAVTEFLMTQRATTILAAAILLMPMASAYGQTGAQDLAGLGLADLLAVRAVTGARHDQRVIDSPRAITIVTADDIRKRNFRNTAAALFEVAGVFMQQTNDGAGSPIIRGLVGNQVLVLVDGVRLNNGTYRLGPNQYLNTIDVHSIERIEIVRGAGSVLYGSDALGGVINIITKPATPTDTATLTSRVFTRLSSANRGMTGRAELSGAKGPIAFVGGATLEDFSMMRGGNNVGLQPQTGYSERDADAKLTVRLAEHQAATFVAQRVSQSNIRRPGTFVRWDPQTRTLASGRYTAGELRGPVDELSVTASFHQQAERYFATPATGDRMEHFDRTNSIAAALQLTSALGARHRLTYGIDAQKDLITSRREDVSRTTGARRTAPGIVADGSTYLTYAAFLQDEIDVSPRLHLNLGARYGVAQPLATVAGSGSDTFLIDTPRRALTGSAFGLFRVTSAIEIVGGVAQGFRAPNMNDLTILGPRQGGYEVPNAGLDAETSQNLEIGARARNLRGWGGATYFLSDIEGLIQREAGTFEGKSFRDANLNGVRDTGEPLVFQRQNTGSGRIQGAELEGQLRLADRWTLAGTLTHTFGEDTTKNQPLRRIPPTYGTLRLAWTSGGRVWADGYSTFATRQTRLSPDDLVDSRIPAGGTPGFVTLHARGGLQLTPAIDFTLGVENLTDLRYRTHGSGVDMPGRNLVVGFAWIF